MNFDDPLFKRKMIFMIILPIMLYSTLFAYSLYQNLTEDELLIHDISRLFPEKVAKIVQGKEEQALIDAVLEAKEQNLKVSIAGARHSQGGHAFYKDSVWLDMRDYNEILHLDKEKKTITVQSGATWEDIQEYINPYGLSVKVMQSSNIFTVGGSLSSNVHGRDPHYGPIIETVQSFRLLTADGTIKQVSRTENQELFPLVIGGYGLFGVILDVTLELTDDVLYVSETEKIDYKEYPAYFEENILPDDEVGLHFARLSIKPDALFEEMYMTTFRHLDKTDEWYPAAEEEYNELTLLQEETNIGRDKFFLGLSRKFDWGKDLIWYLQQRIYGEDDEGEVVSRNNAMRPPVEFLEHDDSKTTDILQEYFIPKKSFASFVDQLREIVVEEDLNLLNVTVRYTKAHEEGVLNYAEEDTFAFVLLFNHSLSEKGIYHMKQATQKIVDAAIAKNGKYYLTYQRFPAGEQIRAAYPNIDYFFEMKREVDPEERFMNNFYEEYSRNEH